MFWISESTSFSDTGNALPHDTRALPETPVPSPIPPQRDDSDVAKDDAGVVGYAEERLYNDTIWAMRFSSLNRATIDRWLDSYRRFHQQAAPGALVYLLLHLDAQIATFPAYARMVAREVNLMQPDLQAYVAIVLPRNTMGQILKLFLWSLSTTWRLSTVRAFFDEPDALAWLSRQVDYNSPPAAHA
jgi:hypothetical protein